LLADESEICVRECPERRIVLGEPSEYGDGRGFYGAFARFCAARHTPELNLSYPIGGYFDDMERFLDASSRPARFFSHDPQGDETISEGLYLTGRTRGYYGQTNGLPRRMADYADKNGLTFTGPVYNTYLRNVPRFLFLRINFPHAKNLDFGGFFGCKKFAPFQNTPLTFCQGLLQLCQVGCRRRSR
jgi:hypothetical protein